jgi:membrane protease YdiL (CAAX protease family)
LYHVDALAPATAAWLTASAILLIYGFQVVVALSGLPLLFTSIAGDVAAVAMVATFCRRHGVRGSRVGLRRPERRFIVAAVLIGVSMWFVALMIVNLFEAPGGGDSSTRGLEHAIKQPGLLATLFGIALLPAIAEEIVFRGILLRALARRFVPWFGVVLSAVIFGLFHLIPLQMISTFILGLVFGTLTLCAESAIPAMVAHVLNNTVVILISRDSIPVVGASMGAHMGITFGAAVTLTTAGLVVAARRRRSSP